MDAPARLSTFIVDDTLDLSNVPFELNDLKRVLESPSIRKVKTLLLRRKNIGEEGAQALAASKNLQQLTTLNLHNNVIGDEGAQALANSEHLQQLTTLDLSSNNIGYEGAEALAFSKNFQQLTTLSLCGNAIGDEGVQELAFSKNLQQLTTLDLSSNDIGYLGAEALAFSKNLQQLTTLDLSNNDIIDEGAELLADSKNLKQLTALVLGSNFIGNPAARALANSENLQRLTTLNLYGNSIGEEGVKALANSEHLQQLTILDLHDNRIGKEGAQALAASKNLKRLTMLDLGVNDIGDEGVQALAASQSLQQLTTLDLAANHMGNKGAQALAASKNLKQLTYLDLFNNTIGIEGAQALAASQNLQQLTYLDLGKNAIGNEGAQALAASQNLQQLTSLSLDDNAIGNEGAQALAASKNLQHLTQLNLGSNNIGDMGTRALANSEHLQELTTLDLGGNFIGDEGAEALAFSKNLQQLTSLDLDANSIGIEGALALANSEQLQQLTSLDLRANFIGNEGARALAASKNLQYLTTLNLNSSGIGHKGAQALAASKNLQHLTQLNLGSNDIGDEGVQVLAASKNLQHLTRLDVGFNSIGTEGAQALAASKNLQQLTELYLGSNSVGTEGAHALANSEHLQQLTELYLSDNDIGDEGVRALVLSQSLANLTEVNFRNNTEVNIPEPLLSDIHALRDYFRLKETEIEKELLVVRALIIGQPSVGKSTLFRALTNQSLDWGALPRTHGVDRQPLNIRVKQDLQPEKEVKLNLMDFGGQRLQMMAHSLFFSDKGIYLMVVNQETTSEDVAFWLENIQNMMDSRDDVLILPVRNPLLRENAGVLPPKVLTALAPNISQHFNLAHEVTLNIQASARDNSARTNSESQEANLELNVDVDVENIKDALSYSLAAFPFRTGFEVHVNIAEYIESQLTTLFPEPFYKIDAFDQIIKLDHTIDEMLRNALKRANIDAKHLGRFKRELSVYLDYMGVLTRLETEQTNEHGKVTGYIIVAPDLVQRALHCVFPPEDALRDTNSAPTLFYNRMVAASEITGLTGCFTRGEFKHLTEAVFEQAVSLHGDADAFSQELLEILCHKKLGLIIPLAKGQYLVPSYIEEPMPYHQETQAGQILCSWGRAQQAYVIELSRADETIHFASFFLYKFMVHCRNDSREAATQHSNSGVFVDIDLIRTQRCVLRWAHEPSIYAELVGYEGKIWCFGFSENAEYSGEVEGLINVVYDELRRYFYHTSASTKFNITRAIPCPNCLTKLTSHADSSVELTLEAARKLNDVFLFQNSSLMGLESGRAGEQIRCEVDSLHRFYPLKLKGYLAENNQAGQAAIVEAERITREDVLHSTAIIYEFLHDEGLGRLVESHANPELPNLFPGGGVGPTEKTTAELVRWHYQLSERSNPPGDTFCDKAISHLLNRIPIFRIWAGIHSDSTNVKQEQYYPHMKKVAKGLEENPNKYLDEWVSAFPDVKKRAVGKKLREKF